MSRPHRHGARRAGATLVAIGLSTLSACTSSDPRNPHGIHFTDVTTEALGAPRFGGPSEAGYDFVGSGAALADLDGDGKLDLILARNDDPAAPLRQPSALWRNTSDGGRITFVEDPTFAPLLAGRRCHGVAVGDFDGDGDLDLFIAAAGADVLLANDGSGHFADVSAAAGIAGPADDISVGALWADVNHDGLLDLYVVGLPPFGFPAIVNNRLYLNGGGGAFEDVSLSSGACLPQASWVALANDFDGDGRLDLFVGNDAFLYPLQRNAMLLRAGSDEARLSFEDRTPAAIVEGARFTMGATARDVDGDGVADLYLTNIGGNPLFLGDAAAGPAREASQELGVGVAKINGGWGLADLGSANGTRVGVNALAPKGRRTRCAPATRSGSRSVLPLPRRHVAVEHPALRRPALAPVGAKWPAPGGDGPRALGDGGDLGGRAGET